MIFQKLCIGRVNQIKVPTILELGITAGDRQHVHLSKTIAKAMEAGHVRIDRPAIIEVDTTRAIADGNTIFRAGKVCILSNRHAF